MTLRSSSYEFLCDIFLLYLRGFVSYLVLLRKKQTCRARVALGLPASTLRVESEVHQKDGEIRGPWKGLGGAHSGDWGKSFSS